MFSAEKEKAAFPEFAQIFSPRRLSVFSLKNVQAEFAQKQTKIGSAQVRRWRFF
jgi:hypothetical protein